MRPFFAITGLTLKNALRSHVFQILLLLLLLCVGIIPFSIGGGSAQDFVRVSLLYSIWTITLVLALSSLWLGCYIMAQDVDSYQLHMVTAKPVSRVVIWLGKWIGINLINFTLLIISLAAVYGIVMYRYNKDDRFTQADRARIASEVLVGRRVFLPTKPDFAKMARQALQEKMKQTGALSREEQDKLFGELLQQIGAGYSELPAGQVKGWIFENLPDIGNEPLFLRYRPYLGKVSSEDQRVSHVQWIVMRPSGEAVLPSGEKVAANEWPQPLSEQPDQVFTGAFYEKTIPGEWKVITPDNKVRVAVVNHDKFEGKHYYQPSDGPKLLLRICSFEGNYLRMVLVVMIQLLLLSALACAFGGFLTMPTAVFLVVSYLMLGSFSTLLTDQSFFVSSAWDQIGQNLAKLLLIIVIPLQAFDVTDLLSTGELIEYSLIWKLFLHYFILRGVPLFLFGIWMYRRRELGLAVRK